MKKILMTAVIASMLIVPLGNTALAGDGEAAAPIAVQDFLPGDVPAETAAAESMLPAVHGLALAMLNHDAGSFDFDNGALAWEGLYNMLSLYGQLDSRCDARSGELLLPEETVRDYAAALGLDLDCLPALPEELGDRISYDGGCYRLVCGDAGLAQFQSGSPRSAGGELILDCFLYDPAEDETLARFQAVLQPRDNMFGFVITALTAA